jgi:hypothetical protein
MGAELWRRAANVERDEPARLLDAPEQEKKANAQEANECAVEAIIGECGLRGFKQASREPEVARRERYLATRGKDARTHRIATRQPPLGAAKQLLRGAILTELRHRHTSERERFCILAQAEEAQRTQGIETRKLPRRCLEMGIVSQLLLPGWCHRAVHQNAWKLMASIAANVQRRGAGGRPAG